MLDYTYLDQAQAYKVHSSLPPWPDPSLFTTVALAYKTILTAAITLFDLQRLASPSVVHKPTTLNVKMQFFTTLAALFVAVSATLTGATPVVEARQILYCGTQPYKPADVCHPKG